MNTSVCDSCKTLYSELIDDMNDLPSYSQYYNSNLALANNSVTALLTIIGCIYSPRIKYRFSFRLAK